MICPCTGIEIALNKVNAEVDTWCIGIEMSVIGISIYYTCVTDSLFEKVCQYKCGRKVAPISP